MRPSDWARDHLLATAAAFLLLAALAAVSASGTLLWLVLGLLGDGPVVATLGTLLPLFLVGLVVGAPLAPLALVVLGYGLAARAVDAASERATAGTTRVGRTVRDLERRAARVGLGEVADAVGDLDPRSPERRAEDRVERLQSEYVDGRLSEFELERRVRGALDDEAIERERVTALDAQVRDRRAETER